MMRNKSLGVFMAFACVLGMALYGTVQAAFLAGKGTVSGTVTNDDGKPVVGLAIRLEQQIPMTAGSPGGRKGKTKSGVGDGGASGLQGKQERVKIAAKGVTDAQGKFSFPNIDEGSYQLIAGSKNVGWIYQDVVVKPNEETKFDNLKLIKVK